MARKPKTIVADKIRIKLLADLAEGKSESIAVVTAKRAEELFAARQARRVQVGDFNFTQQA